LFKLIRLAVVLLLIVWVAGCSSANNGTELGNPLSFTVIGSGFNLTDGTDDARVMETFADQASFDNVLNQYSLATDGELIDFSSYQVVLVSTGSNSNGGYSIATESVRDVGDYIELNILLSSPGASCAVTTAFTHPYQLLKINSKKALQFNVRNVTESCN